MIVARIALSDDGKLRERAAQLDAHKAHIRTAAIRILQSGPISEPSGEWRGGLIIADVTSMLEMQVFSDSDPFVVHGVYRNVHLVDWKITFGAMTGDAGAVHP